MVPDYLEMVCTRVKGQRRQPDQPKQATVSWRTLSQRPRQRRGLAEQRSADSGHRAAGGMSSPSSLATTSCAGGCGLLRRRRLKPVDAAAHVLELLLFVFLLVRRGR